MTDVTRLKPMNEADLQETFNDMDRDSNGTADEIEFVAWWTGLVKEQSFTRNPSVEGIRRADEHDIKVLFDQFVLPFSYQVILLVCILKKLHSQMGSILIHLIF